MYAGDGVGMSFSGKFGGALDSPRFFSSHLSMSSARPTKGRLPRSSIMSSLRDVLVTRERKRES